MISFRIKIYILCLSVLFVNGVNGDVLFEDHFTDGVADGWDEIIGVWSVIGEEYVGIQEDVDQKGLYTTTGDPTWSNYTIKARMKLELTDPDWNDFGIIFYHHGNEYIRFTLGNGDAPPTARITHDVYSVISDEFDTFAELATIVSEPIMISGKWYNVQLCIYNNYVYAYVDDQLVAYADNLPLTDGYIGLVADDPTVYFDDIIVTTNTTFPATVDIVKSITTKSKSITCNIWPPTGYDVTEIDTSSILLNDGTHYGIQPVSVMVRRKQQMLVTKFSTSELSLVQDETLNLTISGVLTDSNQFESSDFVVVVKKGRKPN